MLRPLRNSDRIDDGVSERPRLFCWGRRFNDAVEARRLTRPWHKHESRSVRRITNRKVRHATRNKLRKGEYDLLPFSPRTEDWETWYRASVRCSLSGSRTPSDD